MKLDVRAFALTCGFFFAGTVLVVGVLDIALGGYGRAVLELFASLYPGYEAEDDLIVLLIGAVLAFVDGVVGGAAFAWLYGRLTGSPSRTAHRPE